MEQEESILDMCSPSAKRSIPMSSGGVPILQPGAINVYAIIPCPLKVRYKVQMEEFIARNANAGMTPVYCPTMLDGSPKNIEDHIFNAKSEDDLPDILVTTGIGTVFSRQFREKFLDSKIFTGITKPEYLKAMPKEYVDAAARYNIGFLAFGSWSIVWDLSCGENLTTPKSWADLTKPEFHDQLSIHGYHGKASGTSLLMVLKKRAGDDAIGKFAGNIKNIKHFAEVIKGINSPDPKRAPFNILPNAASMQMPSRKKAAMLEFEDGPLMAPLFIFVKTSRIKEAQPALDYFWSDQFRAVLEVGDFHMPDKMDWTKNYTYPSWDELAAQDFPELSEALNVEFSRGLPQQGCSGHGGNGGGCACGGQKSLQSAPVEIHRRHTPEDC